MLAKDFHKYSHNITFPCYVQPKLDGVRCLSKRINGNIQFISRKGKKFETIEHINNQLKMIMDVGEILDGEIYIHGEEFQDIISAIKNIKNKSKAKIDSSKLNYYIYDVADDTLDFKDRYKKLSAYLYDIIEKNLFNLIIVPTFKCNNKDEVKKWHDKFKSDGYEGVIIRNIKGKYEFDFRSNNLQKYKEFMDEEYKIIGVKSGKGRYKDCGTFICEMDNGKTFDCNPIGTIEQKQEYLKNKDKYIGSFLTVFPVGIAVRNYE